MGKDEVKAILHTGGKSDRILMEEGGMVSIKIFHGSERLQMPGMALR